MALLKKIGDKYGRIDVLVPNQACSTHFGDQLNISESQYDKLWDLNVKSVFFLIKEAKDLLLASKNDANILIVSSVTGKNPHYTIGVYGMTKAALDNLVIWMAQELMNDDIRVNGVAPGLIMTEFSGVLWKNNDMPHPKSKGTSEEIGSVCATICSKDGSFMNGEVY